MKCSRMEVLLSCYLDGELSPSQTQAVDGHLLECSSCSQEYRTLKKNQMTLSSLTRKEVSPEVWPAIKARIRTSKVTPLVARQRVWKVALRVGLLAACLLILFLSVVAVGYYSPDSTAEVTPSNQVSQRNFMDGHAQFIGEDDPMSDKAAWAYVRSHQAIGGALGEESPSP